MRAKNIQVANVSCIRHSLKGHSDIILTISYTTNRLSIYDAHQYFNWPYAYMSIGRKCANNVQLVVSEGDRGVQYVSRSKM